MLRILKPTPLAILIALLALAVVGVLSSTATATYSPASNGPEQSVFSIGIGAPISVITINGSQSWQVQWGPLVLQVAVIFLGSNLMAIHLIQAVKFRHPALTYGIAGLVLIVLTFLGAIGTSRAYWGYWFSPPKLLPQAGLISEVRGVFAFKTDPVATGKPVTVPDLDDSLASLVERGRKYGDDAFSDRVLVALDTRGLLPDQFSTNHAFASEIYQLVLTNGILLESSPGYDSSGQVAGIAIDAADAAGNRCLFLAFAGGQLSNDHYPYYEAFFQGGSQRPTWALVHSQHYFYDVAGMEGFEWPIIWIIYSVIGVPLGLLLFTVGRIALRARAAASL
jgi:hypothetical protein